MRAPQSSLHLLIRSSLRAICDRTLGRSFGSRRTHGGSRPEHAPEFRRFNSRRSWRLQQFLLGSGKGVSTAGFRRGSSHLFRMIGAGGILRYGLAVIAKAVIAGMRLFALPLKDTRALIDGIRGRSSGLLVLAVERLKISRVFMTACCAETVDSPCLSPTDVAKLRWVKRGLI